MFLHVYAFREVVGTPAVVCHGFARQNEVFFSVLDDHHAPVFERREREGQCARLLRKVELVRYAAIDIRAGCPHAFHAACRRDADSEVVLRHGCGTCAVEVAP